MPCSVCERAIASSRIVAHIQAPMSRNSQKNKIANRLYMAPLVRSSLSSTRRGKSRLLIRSSQAHPAGIARKGLPLKPDKCGTRTLDYKRNGTMTLIATLNILYGTVVELCMPKHTHKHKRPNVVQWLANHPCWTFHFTPTWPPGSMPSKSSQREHTKKSWYL